MEDALLWVCLGEAYNEGVQLISDLEHLIFRKKLSVLLVKAETLA